MNAVLPAFARQLLAQSDLRGAGGFDPPRMRGVLVGAAQAVEEDGREFRVRAGAAGLRSRREADLHRALARLADTGTAVRVGRYSLVGPRQDPADRLAETQAVVKRRRWTDSITTYDDTGVGDPALRPQMARLIAALDAGEIHGIVAVSQVDISPFDDIYTHTLAVLRARRSFLALARSETSI